MGKAILGIHHVTAIASDPQRNLDFCTRVLALRLVKLTVNYDDPHTYHFYYGFYYGDGHGHPGTILTFFPWPVAKKGPQGLVTEEYRLIPSRPASSRKRLNKSQTLED